MVLGAMVKAVIRKMQKLEAVPGSARQEIFILSG
jgi:hypothetical protein